MIRLNNIIKTYKAGACVTEALKGVSLEVKSGEMLSIMGASGSGKSTLLNVIGCMDRFDSGEYLLDGIEVHKLSENKLHSIRKKYISMVFQNFALLNHNSVYENIELPLIARGVAKKDRKIKVDEIAERLGIQDLLQKLPTNISGGEQQRCAIARAVISDCKVILADEPTGSLDYSKGMEIMDVLSSIKDKAIIVVTHNKDVAARTDRIIKISDGRLE